MIVVDTESIIYFDVDDTLVMWGMADDHPGLINIPSPHYGTKNMVVPHPGHIKVLKDRKARGSRIVVWSAGGFAWAEAVVKALGLEQYVDFVMSKPHMYVDDKLASEFMGERLYIPYGDGYGT